MWVSYIIGASAPGPRDTRETPFGERTEGYIDPKLESGCDLPGREKEMEEAGSVDLTCSKFAAPVSRSLSLSVVPLLLATLDDLMPTERRRQTDLRRGERERAGGSAPTRAAALCCVVAAGQAAPLAKP